MRPATMMLTTILLLGSASVAAAECAWVLWQHALGSWVVSGARPSYKQCEDYRRQVIELLIAEHNWPKDRRESWIRERMESFAKKGTGSTCLPDTIDPREKKE